MANVGAAGFEAPVLQMTGAAMKASPAMSIKVDRLIIFFLLGQVRRYGIKAITNLSQVTSKLGY
jgi:hypothetical protein